jgi:hypothetical protein
MDLDPTVVVFDEAEFSEFVHKEIHARARTAQLTEDVEWRKDVAEKTGLGFALPAEISFGLLGQPKVVKREKAKAA